MTEQQPSTPTIMADKIKGPSFLINWNGKWIAPCWITNSLYQVNFETSEVNLFGGSGSNKEKGHKNGPLNEATFDAPSCMVIEPNTGDLLVSENHCIRRISKEEPHQVSTFAGKNPAVAGYQDGDALEAAVFDCPRGMAYDSKGNLFVCDQHNHVIRKISSTNGKPIVSTFCGTPKKCATQDGTAKTGHLYFPNYIVADKEDNLFISQMQPTMQVIRKVLPNGDITTFVGSAKGFKSGVGNTAKFNEPGAMVVDDNGTILVCDKKNAAIRKITKDGDVSGKTITLPAKHELRDLIAFMRDKNGVLDLVYCEMDTNYKHVLKVAKNIQETAGIQLK